MNENDELLDLVDSADLVIGTIRRGDMAKAAYRTTEGYVRFAVAFIVNDKGAVWVPIRGMHKAIAPGGLDFSVAEHVLSGESYEQAIERAFAEEAGMKVEARDLVCLGKLCPTEAKPTYETAFVYFMHGRRSPKYSHEEFTSARWMSASTLEARLLSGPPTKSALLPAYRLLQTYIDH